MRPSELARDDTPMLPVDRARRRMAGAERLVARDHRAAAADLAAAHARSHSPRGSAAARLACRLRGHRRRTAAAPVARLRDARSTKGGWCRFCPRAPVSPGGRMRGRPSCATGRCMRSGGARCATRAASTVRGAARSSFPRESRSRSTRRRIGTRPTAGLRRCRVQVADDDRQRRSPPRRAQPGCEGVATRSGGAEARDPADAAHQPPPAAGGDLPRRVADRARARGGGARPAADRRRPVALGGRLRSPVLDSVPALVRGSVPCRSRARRRGLAWRHGRVVPGRRGQLRRDLRPYGPRDVRAPQRRAARARRIGRPEAENAWRARRGTDRHRAPAHRACRMRPSAIRP